MRAMIVGAGLGTRLRPLTDLRPKPALPIGGIPLVGYTLGLLAHHGVSEVVINVHHLADQLIGVARRHCPPGVTLRFSVEAELLDTGGGIRRVADFLRESDPCLIVGGDMLVDTDLSALVARHRARGDDVSFQLLRDESREAEFGTIGVCDAGRLRRIGDRFDLGGETRRGIYTWVNVASARALDTLPDREVFSHLDDWLAPLARSGGVAIHGELVGPDDCTWRPVGTPAEYLAANLDPPALSYAVIGRPARRIGTDVVVGCDATLGPDVDLARCVIWDGEHVTGPTRARDAVFAGGAFHPVGP